MVQNIAVSLVLTFSNDSIGSRYRHTTKQKFINLVLAFSPFMNKVMVEHITIGVIGEEQIGEVLESGATDIIFKIISTERPSTMEELRVPAGNVKVKGN